MMKARVEKRALAMRYLAVIVANARGASYRDDHLRIEYRAASEDRPHGVDIWRSDDRTTKVLNVIWRGDDAVVVSYRGGPWERALKRAAGV